MKDPYQRTFKYLQIPAAIWINPMLTTTEKCFLGEVLSLDDNGKGCWANNDHFAELFNTSNGAIRVMICLLKKAGYLYDVPPGDKERRLMVRIPPPEIVEIWQTEGRLALAYANGSWLLSLAPANASVSTRLQRTDPHMYKESTLRLQIPPQSVVVAEISNGDVPEKEPPKKGAGKEKNPPVMPPRKTREVFDPESVIPDHFKTPEFRAAWNDWILFKSSGKKISNKHMVFSRHIVALSAKTTDPSTAIALINKAISRNWAMIVYDDTHASPPFHPAVPVFKTDATGVIPAYGCENWQPRPY